MEKLEIVETENDVILTLSQVIEQKSQSAISERSKFVVGLSGLNKNHTVTRQQIYI